MNHWKTIALAALTLVLLAILFFQPGHRPDFSDTEVYRGGGVKALAHQTVYDVKGHYTFNYPPFAAVFYALTLAQLPFQNAAWTFFFSVGTFMAHPDCPHHPGNPKNLSREKVVGDPRTLDRLRFVFRYGAA